MKCSIQIVCERPGRQVTVKDINDKLNERFQKIKAANPYGFLDQFESQCDGIMMEVAQELGGSLSFGKDDSYIFNFTRHAAIKLMSCSG